MIDIWRLLLFLARFSRHIRRARIVIVGALAAGLVSGVGYSAMIAVISRSLAAREGGRLLVAFVALAVAVPVARLASMTLLNWLGPKAVFDLRLSLCRKILAAPLQKLEALGAHRLLVVLTEDVTAITTALLAVGPILVHSGTICACLVYLAWLSPRLMLLTLLLMLFGAATYAVPLQKARAIFQRMRRLADDLYHQFEGLLRGAKELKLHHLRQAAFFDRELIPTGETIRRATFVSNTLLNTASVWGNILFFITLGILAFSPIAAVSGADRTRVVTAYALSLLYIMAPMESIFALMPALGRAMAAAARIEALGFDLGTSGAERLLPHQDLASWRTIELAGVTYAYHPHGSEAGFHIGPLDLTFRPGELIFIVGGNGSGKTTFAKLLTGLYLPDSGCLRVDGRAVDDESRSSYRQLFSTVFSDFYLFESLLGIERLDLDEAAAAYLRRLELADKVRVEGGVLSSVELSQGQRKRLALLVAYLEERPIYFFDEWAADQDPHFREVFYFEILPALRARGKTVFLISHDDRYFALADRILKLNYGQVEWDVAGAEAAAAGVKAAAPPAPGPAPRPSLQAP